MTGSNGAGHSVFVVGLSGLALGADALNQVEALGAVAFAGVEVVELVGAALDAANSLVDIVELSIGALGAVVVDEVVAGFADASVEDPVFVD